MKGDEPLGANRSPHMHREVGGYYQGTLDLQSLQSSWYLRLNMCIEEVYVCAHVCVLSILMCVRACVCICMHPHVYIHMGATG